MKDEGGQNAQRECNGCPVAAVRPNAEAETQDGSHAEEFEDVQDHAFKTAP